MNLEWKRVLCFSIFSLFSPCNISQLRISFQLYMYAKFTFTSCSIYTKPSYNKYKEYRRMVKHLGGGDRRQWDGRMLTSVFSTFEGVSYPTKFNDYDDDFQGNGLWQYTFYYLLIFDVLSFCIHCSVGNFII